MNKNQIFVEGIADAKLIQDLIKSWYNIDLEFVKNSDEVTKPDILITYGKDSIRKLFPLFEINTNENVKNIVIFDADIFKIENKKFIEYQKEVTLDYYLLPDNEDGKDNRDLETLLEQIIPEENKFIFECWENFYKCLELKGEDKLHLPTTKKKIWTYLELLLGEHPSTQSLKKEPGRDYQNQNHWNLNAPALVNLKQFLDQYFQKIP